MKYIKSFELYEKSKDMLVKGDIVLIKDEWLDDPEEKDMKFLVTNATAPERPLITPLTPLPSISIPDAQKVKAEMLIKIGNLKDKEYKEQRKFWEGK